jgi:hypothetical protein
MPPCAKVAQRKGNVIGKNQTRRPYEELQKDERLGRDVGMALNAAMT